MQVLCTKILASRNKFRSFVGENEYDDQHNVVEACDAELDGDLLKLSHCRRNFEEFDDIIDNNSDPMNICSCSHWENMTSPDILFTNSSFN